MNGHMFIFPYILCIIYSLHISIEVELKFHNYVENKQHTLEQPLGQRGNQEDFLSRKHLKT